MGLIQSIDQLGENNKLPNKFLGYQNSLAVNKSKNTGDNELMIDPDFL